MPRYASIDIGTNSVLLLIAEANASGTFEAVLERAEITRLGRGVDRSKRLAPEAIEGTLQVLESFAADARRLRVQWLVVSATSAARDASNGADFIAQAKARAGLDVEIIAGDEEARLSFTSAFADFGGASPLVVLDIGGGSTEFIFGAADGRVGFRRSFDVGSVRLTERFVATDPVSQAELASVRAHLEQTFAALPAPPAHARLVAVAGTATTVCAVCRQIEPYDASKVHAAVLSRAEVSATLERLRAMPVDERRRLPGLQPKRADVIAAGALVLDVAMARLGATEVTISDRGLRWGLLVDRFGAMR